MLRIRVRSSVANSLSRYSRSKGSNASQASFTGRNRVRVGVELRKLEISGVRILWK